MTGYKLSLMPVLLLVGFFLLSFPDAIHACSCPVIEPDYAYQRAAIIFTGTVNQITELKGKGDTDGSALQFVEGHLTRFTVEEFYKGRGGAEVELRGGNTSCDIHFEVGKRYLVYASENRDTGVLGAFSCSRTGLLNNYLQADISYLKRVVQGASPTMLYGFVFRSTGESKFGESDPLGDLAVTVEGEGKRFELKTNAGGYFEAFDLPAGKYRVQIGATEKLRGADLKTVELRSGRVSSVKFRTTTMGALSGRVIDQEGQPVHEIQVYLIGTQGKARPGLMIDYEYETTTEDGRFMFAEVPTGPYRLAVNFRGQRSLYNAPFLPSYYPNAASSAEAQVVTVTDGIVSELNDFVLQKRYPTVAVSGVVVTADGKPIEGAYVYLDQTGGTWDVARPVRTDTDGRFVQQAFEGLIYKLRAGADGPNGAGVDSESVEVTAGKNARPVRLVIKFSK
jgi:hypothetical protein